MSRDLLLVFEPLGARELHPPLRIGADDHCEVRIPHADGAPVLTIDRTETGWICTAHGDGATLNAVPMASGSALGLQAGDVVRIASSILRVSMEQDQLRLQVEHPEGNETLPLPQADARLQFDDVAQERVVARQSTAPWKDVRAVGAKNSRSEDAPGVNRKVLWSSIAGIILVLALVVTALSRLQPVTFTVEPTQASVSGSGLGWTSGNTLFLLPGERRISVSAAGYSPLQKTVPVVAGQSLSLEFRLEPLPGILQVDTAGIRAELFVDGARAGSVPGEFELAQGARTLTLRAEKYFDEIRPVEIEGFGIRQLISVSLRPAFGSLLISAEQSQATVRIEGRDGEQALPAEIELPAGLQRLEIAAPGAKPWRGVILVEAGAQQTIGPISLGAPDAIWQIQSRPAGAAVTVNGVFRGRTPLELSLTPQIEQQIMVGEQGYNQVERRVRPSPGERQTLQVDLNMRQVAVTVEGEPSAVEILAGGRVLGLSPMTLQLPARPIRLELRKQGFAGQRVDVDLSPGVARRVDYRLVPEGRSQNWRPPEKQIQLAQGPLLRLIEGGQFVMGSGRREQGRRSNEWQRSVTLQRPFYIGTREVTNAEFRRFRPGHASGFIGKRSLDLDGQPVTSVRWEDAVEYCNWLSEQNGITPAYVRQDGRWVLVQPVNSGYRLPTEAEWEFVSRVEPQRGGVARRYPWGMELPPPAGSANLAGEEAAAELTRVFSDWRDEHVAVAPTGVYAANAWGLYDLLGNVSEWMHDAYATVPEGEPIDPAGPVAASRVRVIKGASWRTSNFSELRVAWRDGRDGPADDLGFRLARYAEDLQP